MQYDSMDAALAHFSFRSRTFVSISQADAALTYTLVLSFRVAAPNGAKAGPTTRFPDHGFSIVLCSPFRSISAAVA